MPIKGILVGLKMVEAIVILGAAKEGDRGSEFCTLDL